MFYRYVHSCKYRGYAKVMYGDVQLHFCGCMSYSSIQTCIAGVNLNCYIHKLFYSYIQRSFVTAIHGAAHTGVMLQVHTDLYYRS